MLVVFNDVDGGVGDHGVVSDAASIGSDSVLCFSRWAVGFII